MKICDSQIPNDLLKQMISRAETARDLAYAPYSNFHVGAAILSSNGKIFQGNNYETANYDGMCAERSAVSSAVSNGFYKFIGIAISTNVENDTTPPCGRCRQLLRESLAGQPNEYEIHLVNKLGKHEVFTLEELLPKSFGPSDLFSPKKMQELDEKYRNDGCRNFCY